MEIESTSGPRFDLALDRLELGEMILFRGAGIRLECHEVLYVIAWSEWGEARYVTRADVDAALARANAAADLLMAESPRFARFAAQRRRVVEVALDHGTGATSICRQDAGELKWASKYVHLNA